MEGRCRVLDFMLSYACYIVSVINKYVYIYIYMYVCIYIYVNGMYTSICRVCLYVYLYVYVDMHMYMCVYIYIYTGLIYDAGPVFWGADAKPVTFRSS